VRAATIFGTSLHLLVDTSVANATIARDLDSEVNDIAPTLEDVFVQLTETRGREVEASR
jgi:hypothetical protein